ncbi:hypothetical protein HYPSUDRAFT_254722 [Hypholoma sublateritium FD-334 SS-4]|uniref:NADH:flavin oxidoreductase/NADH oxidase N-terminal domain-containing protein n=1 Tax=Hypholoma sublateritium (strain FD-334 SS-4) TaxID=945553 RepID=A0A0D2PPE8_HYPSF|nr:hypothetical protein HYPSUDRAFT_254722 [Hypholoma sublateritium FD-334 SS-4]
MIARTEASAETSSSSSVIFSTVKLPSGRRARNRLVKVAMYEHLASFGGGPPNSYHLDLYSQWAKHSWGMIITGNVIITDDHLTLGRDLILPPSLTIDSESTALPFKKLADAIHGIDFDTREGQKDKANETLAIMQLSHGGRQSANIVGGRFPFQKPLAPSSTRLAPSDSSLISRALNGALFQIPRAMSQNEINEVIDRFVEGAIFAYKCGFDGVQLHAAHGYLLAQFLSPKSNKRDDIYSVQNALDIIQTIVSNIRERTSSTFIICIKLNAAEYTSAADANNSLSNLEQRAMDHILAMATWGLLDIIEISGGDYEKPDFVMAEDVPRSRRQAFFSSFSHKALQALESLKDTISTPLPLILLTGGLKSLDLLDTVLDSRHAHLLGIGRASVTCPNLPCVVQERSKNPRQWDGELFGREPNLKTTTILTYPPFSWCLGYMPDVKLIGAGAEVAWHVLGMRQIATSSTDIVNVNCGGLTSVLGMWFWIPYACRGANNSKKRLGLSRTFNISNNWKVMFLSYKMFFLLAVFPIAMYLILCIIF